MRAAWRASSPGERLVFAAIVSILALLHAYRFDRLDFADDAYFATALDQASLFGFLRERYLSWSGRLPIDALAALLLDHVWLWRVLNFAMVLAFCANVARLGFGAGGKAPVAIACVLGLWLLFPLALLQDAAWWVTGSFNYLWPATAGLFAVRAMFERHRRTTVDWALIACAGGFAAYSEQVAIVLLGLGVPRWWQLWRSGRFGPGDAALCGAISVNAAINLLAPGAQLRFAAETVRWYPDYDLLDVIDKLHLALGLVATTLGRTDHLAAAVLVAVAGVLVWHARVARGVRIALLGGLGFLALAHLAPFALPPGTGLLHRLTVVAVTAANGAASSPMIVLALTLFGGACVVAGTFVAVRERSLREAAWLAHGLLVGWASLAAVAFSPTVYASGERTRFVACAVMLVVTCRLIAHARDRFPGAAWHWAAVPLAGVVFLRLVEIA